jgi:hypothetical protein
MADEVTTIQVAELSAEIDNTAETIDWYVFKDLAGKQYKINHRSVEILARAATLI